MSTGQTIYDRQVFYAGDYVFREGDRAQWAYLIQTGEIEILKKTPEGEIRLAALGPGKLFGEMALIDAKPRMAGARATRATTLVLISNMYLQDKLAKSPKLIKELLRTLTHNLRTLTNTKMQELPLRLEAAEAEAEAAVDADELREILDQVAAAGLDLAPDADQPADPADISAPSPAASPPAAAPAAPAPDSAAPAAASEPSPRPPAAKAPPPRPAATEAARPAAAAGTAPAKPAPAAAGAASRQPPLPRSAIAPGKVLPGR